MVGGDDGQVARRQSGDEFGQARVQFLQRVGVAGDVAAVAERLVEVDEIDERERLVGNLVRHFQQRVEQRHVVGALDDARDAVGSKDVADFAQGHDFAAGVLDRVEQGRARRRHGVIVAVAGAAVGAVRAQEGARDHAANVVRLDQLERRFAYRVQALEAEVFFVRGDLHHRVARRVDDHFAGGDMRVAVQVDDVGAGGVTVAEKARQLGDRLQLLGQLKRHRRRCARKIAPVEQHRHAGDFPVAALGVLAGRALVGGAVGSGKTVAPRKARRPFATGAVGSRCEAEALEVRQNQRPAIVGCPAGDVAERVGAGVAEFVGVGRRAQAKGIKQEDECAGHDELASVEKCGELRFARAAFAPRCPKKRGSA